MRSLHPAAADHSVSIGGNRCTALIMLSLRSRTRDLAAQRWYRNCGNGTLRLMRCTCCLCDFCFRCDKRQLSLFVLHFSSRGRYTGFFCQLRGRCTLLDFKFKFQEFINKTNSQVHVFLMLVTGQNFLASEQIKYSAFSRTFLVFGNRKRVSSAQKNKMKPLR